MKTLIIITESFTNFKNKFKEKYMAISIILGNDFQEKEGLEKCINWNHCLNVGMC